MNAKGNLFSTYPVHDLALMSHDDSNTFDGPGLDDRSLVKYHPVTAVADFRTLNDGEVLEGYLDGMHGSLPPGSERSRSYRHGWRNAMIDRGSLPVDDDARALQRDFERLR